MYLGLHSPISRRSLACVQTGGKHFRSGPGTYARASELALESAPSSAHHRHLHPVTNEIFACAPSQEEKLPVVLGSLLRHLSELALSDPCAL